MQNSSKEILEFAAALELGIVPPSIISSVPNVFDQMDPAEAKKSKRKFRKVKRKLAPTNDRTGKKMTSFVTASQIKNYLIEKAALI